MKNKIFKSWVYGHTADGEEIYVGGIINNNDPEKKMNYKFAFTVNNERVVITMFGAEPDCRSNTAFNKHASFYSLLKHISNEYKNHSIEMHINSKNTRMMLIAIKVGCAIDGSYEMGDKKYIRLVYTPEANNHSFIESERYSNLSETVENMAGENPCYIW